MRSGSRRGRPDSRCSTCRPSSGAAISRCSARWRSRRSRARRRTGSGSRSSTVGRASCSSSLTPAQVEKYVMPIVRGEYREAWALTEPGAGSDLAALAATATRDGDEWVLNGEKWFVTSEGDAGFYLVAAVVDGEQELFIVDPGTPGMVDLADAPLPPRPVPRPPSRDRAQRLPGAGCKPGLGRRLGLPRVDPGRAALHRGPLLRRRGAAAAGGDRVGAGAPGVRRRRSSRTRGSRSRSPTRSPSSTRRGS